MNKLTKQATPEEMAASAEVRGIWTDALQVQIEGGKAHVTFGKAQPNREAPIYHSKSTMEIGTLLRLRAAIDSQLALLATHVKEVANAASMPKPDDTKH